MSHRLFGYNSPVLPDLQRANARMAVGDYRVAASIYEKLIGEANFQPSPQLGFFYFQAGRARLQVGETSVAFSHFKRGLEVLSEHQRYAQLYHSGLRIKQDLAQRGLDREARLISAMVHSSMPAASELPTQLFCDESPRSPAACPACGGVLRFTEMLWNDSHSAECPLCDAPIEIS